MPNLPPLPLIDGAFFIDNSSLELLTTCPRALQYNRLNRRVLAAAKPSLSFGSAIHAALEWRYRYCGNTPPDVFQESEQAMLLMKHFQENPPPEDDFRTLNWAIELVKHYNARYQTEPFNLLVDEKGEPLVEQSFALKLYEHDTGYGRIPIYYTGKIDLPVVWEDVIYVIDHKTTSVLGDYFFKDQRVNPQMFGYCYAFEQLTGKTVSGFCINALRSKPMPQKPVGGLDKWWSEGFIRHREFVMPHHLVEWKNNTIALVEEFFWSYYRGFMSQKKKWCVSKYGACNYYDVCDLPPEQRHVLLESPLFIDNNWSPLKEPSQPLQ